MVAVVIGAGGWPKPAPRCGSPAPARRGAACRCESAARPGSAVQPAAAACACLPGCPASTGLLLWPVPPQASRPQPAHLRQDRPLTRSSRLPRPPLPGFLQVSRSPDGSGARQGGTVMPSSQAENCRCKDAPPGWAADATGAPHRGNRSGSIPPRTTLRPARTGRPGLNPPFTGSASTLSALDEERWPRG